MRMFIKALVLGSVLLASGCIVVPVHHCGYYRCW